MTPSLSMTNGWWSVDADASISYLHTSPNSGEQSRSVASTRIISLYKRPSSTFKRWNRKVYQNSNRRSMQSATYFDDIGWLEECWRILVDIVDGHVYVCAEIDCGYRIRWRKTMKSMNRMEHFRKKKHDIVSRELIQTTHHIQSHLYSVGELSAWFAWSIPFKFGFDAMD